MNGDGRIDQIASERPQPRQGAILISASQPAVSDHVRRQDRRKFPGLARVQVFKWSRPRTEITGVAFF
jgi:hypothetical protein